MQIGFPSIAPVQCSKFQVFLNSSVILSHSISDLGSLVYSESFSQMAAGVSLMIIDTVLALIWKENVNDYCESPEAKNFRVSAKP